MPLNDYRNGDGGGSDSDEGSEGVCAAEEELSLYDPEVPVRALSALNALRKSRQHFDVVLLAGGQEVAAHRALLAAASPYLLSVLAAPASPPASQDDNVTVGGVSTYRVEDVEADALRELVDYIYTGRLAVKSAAAARRLYRAAWRLRLEPARAALAERLLRRLTPQDCLDTRALPDLQPHHLQQLDAYIAEHFDEVCSAGALAALPLVRIELLRASSAAGGEEAPAAVADAALAWLRDYNATDSIDELCSRTHLVFVDGGGALRDCGELPAARGDAPELQEYREAAQRRTRQVRPPASAPKPLPGLELGARSARADCAVLAARGGRVDDGAPRVTRALLSLRGRLVGARIAWRDVGEAGGVTVGGPLGGGADASRAPMAVGRCALGAAALRGRLVAVGGYDRARVLRAAEAYDPRNNTWMPLPDMRSARARFPAARLGDKLYVVGGSDGHNELDSVDAYEEGDNGSGKWRCVSRLPQAASHCGLATDGAALWIVGGWAAGRSLRTTYCYRPDKDIWEDGPALNTGRSQCACVFWEGYVWALGGCDAWHCVASTERLKPGGEGWEPAPALPTARRSVGGAVWKGRLVSAGGSDGAASLRRVDWLAGPGEAAWRAGPDLRRARAALGLVVLDDVLYAVGGFDGKEFLSCMECLYSPDGEWTTLLAPPAPAALAVTPPALTTSDDEARETGAGEAPAQ